MDYRILLDDDYQYQLKVSKYQLFMEQNISTIKPRRKPNDRQSRDFICKECSNSYLSYPAAYTHIKKKHPEKNDIQKHIQKPIKDKLVGRGRPRQAKTIGKTLSTESLCIIQDAILKIYQQFQKGNLHQQNIESSRIVLNGNQVVSENDLKMHYDNLMQKQELLPINIFQGNKQKDEQINEELRYSSSEQFIRQALFFQQKINKHFQPSMAAKVRFSLNNLVQKHLHLANHHQRQQIASVWGKSIINDIIENAFTNWLNLRKKFKLNQEL